MTGAELSYRKITETIAGKLDLLEAYLFYCLALNSDCYTIESNKILWNQERRPSKRMAT